MPGCSEKPRIGLIVNALGGAGGIYVSALRHVRLMAPELAVVPISLELSLNEADWAGRVETVEHPLGRAYRILAADLRSDKVFLPDFGDAFMNADLRQRSYVDHLVRLVRRESLSALVVYGAYEWRPLIGAYATAECGLPLIVAFRGVDLEVRIFGRHLAQTSLAVGSAQACVVTSARARRLLEALFKPTCPLFVIPNSIDPQDFDDLEPAAPPLAGPVIGCLGEFRRMMGLDTLLQAFGEIADRRPASLLLIGPVRPMEAGFYTRLIDSHPHSDKIFRIGSVTHRKVLSYLAACQVAAFPSISEGSPNKILEAMLAGCPIVASEAGGIPEMLRHEKDGLLVDGRDAGALSRAIERLLDDPELGRRLADSARSRALEAHAPRVEKRAWLEVYGRLGLCT